MIVITGALGFIGSCMLTKLNQQGHTEIFLVVVLFFKTYKRFKYKK